MTNKLFWQGNLLVNDKKELIAGVIKRQTISPSLPFVHIAIWISMASKPYKPPKRSQKGQVAYFEQIQQHKNGCRRRKI